MNLNIKEFISNIATQNEITLVSIYNLPNTTEAVAELFTYLAEEEINVDMISLTYSLSTTASVSFSAKDSDMSSVLKTIGKIKEKFEDIRTDVNAGNVIFTFEGEKMRNIWGGSATIFTAFKKYGVRIKLITTSETSISCLISEEDYTNAVKMLDEIFSVKRI